jgi:hypothetical protein
MEFTEEINQNKNSLMNIVASNIYGGLGNTMFQIAAGYSTSLNENSDFIVDITGYFGGHHPISKYYNNIFQNVKISNQKINYDVYHEGDFHYCEIPTFHKNIKLNGHYQSEKYFKKNRDKVLELFNCNIEIKEKLINEFGDILKNKTCSIHVRRGDYLRLNNHHPVLSIDYYKESYNIIGEETTYLIFSDDISHCKEQFGFIKNKKFIEGFKDYEELYLMSFCDNNIIANSTFSWWGAWLNKKENVVIAPSKWFGPAYSSYITSDICPEHWVKI